MSFDLTYPAACCDWVFDLNKYVSGTTRKKLTKGNISNLQIPLPSQNEQNKIVGFFSKSDYEIHRLNLHSINLQTLKKKLTGELLLGKLKLK